MKSLRLVLPLAALSLAVVLLLPAPQCNAAGPVTRDTAKHRKDNTFGTRQKAGHAEVYNTTDENGSSFGTIPSEEPVDNTRDIPILINVDVDKRDKGTTTTTTDSETSTNATGSTTSTTTKTTTE